MEEELLILNPKRRRKMSPLQRKYFGGGRRTRRRRNPPAMYAANPHRRRRYRRRYNPPRRRRGQKQERRLDLMGSIMQVLQSGIVGVVGITANNAAGNTAAKLMGVTPGMNTQLVKAGTAVLLPTIVGMIAPQWRRMAAEAGGVALAHEASLFLDKNVWPQLGEVGKILSSTPLNGGTSAKLPPTARNGTGYLPGAQYIQGGQPYTNEAPFIGYLPGGAPYVGGSYVSPYRASASC